MGYVPPKSDLEKLKSPHATIRLEAKVNIISGYNRYRAGMRSGLFGLVFGRWLFPKSGDMKISDANTTGE